MTPQATPVPETMPAWLKRRGISSPVLSHIPIPECPADGFLVRVLAAGVCHSDVGLIQHDSPDPYYLDEYVLGHEGAGVIAAKGAAVKHPHASEFSIGDLVAIHPTAGCGSCVECDTGLPQHCTSCICHGLGRDGSFTWYVAVDVRAIVKVPEGLEVEKAAIATDAVMTAHNSVVRRAQAKTGEKVFVFGLGGLGSNAVQILLHLGCHVFVSDTRAEPLEHAVKLGVTRENMVPLGENVQEWVRAKELRIDTVLDYAGVEQTLNDAIAIVRNGGKIVSVGLLQREITMDYLFCVLKGISILGIFGGLKEDLEEGMDLMVKGIITPRIETAPMHTFPDALQRLHEGKIKGRMVLIPEGSGEAFR